MNILYSYPSIRFTDKTKDVGGEERVAWGTISRMAGRGHSCFITAPDIELEKKYENFTFYPVDGCSLEYASSPMEKRFRAFKYNVKVRKKIKAIVQEQRIDCIHHVRPSYPGFYSSVADLPVPFIYGSVTVEYSGSFEEKETNNTLYNVYKNRKRKLWYRTLENSAFILLEVEFAKYGMPKRFWDKTRVFHNGVDSAAFYPNKKEKPAGAPVEVLFLAGLRRNKGIDVFLRAVPSVVRRFSNIHFTIVGKLLDDVDVEGMVKASGMEKYVTLAGPVDHTEVLGFYHNADIYCLPSRQDNSPNTLVEAMACGKAVISTNIMGIPELITSGENGDLVEPGEPEELADAIAALAADPDRIERYGKRNREIVERELSWERHIDRLEELYREAVNGSGKDK